jgi:uncharacterized protein YbcI
MSAVVQSSSTSATLDVAPNGGQLVEICNRIVRLHKRAFGRGPTKSRAVLADPHSLVVLLEDTLTVSERNLLAMGEISRLHEARIFAQSALGPEACAIVADVLQRDTVAFITGLDPQRDTALHFFTPAPPSSTFALGAGTSLSPRCRHLLP